MKWIGVHIIPKTRYYKNVQKKTPAILMSAIKVWVMTLVGDMEKESMWSTSAIAPSKIKNSMESSNSGDLFDSFIIKNLIDKNFITIFYFILLLIL